MKSFAAMLVVCALALQVATVQAETYTAGRHYEVLPTPVATRNKSKVEVVEVFWYGCSHCFAFEPMVSAWKTTLPADADFHQLPAMWSPVMKLHAQGFYVAKSLGLLEKVHQAFFNTLNLERKRINTADDLARFFSNYGVDRATFDKTINSFGVTSQVNLAESRARSYRITGTPELIVNGKYRVASGWPDGKPMAGSQAEMLKVASFLIEQERAKLPKK